MELRDLRVVHLLKKQSKCEMPFRAELGSLFFVDTCQRQLWVFGEASVSSEVMNALHSQARQQPGMEILAGQDAYRFLLHVATGLASELTGETNIFGQLKEAWQQFSGNSYGGLDAWIQRLFEDTKDIRARFLNSVGGGSYGSLVRRILREKFGNLGIAENAETGGKLDEPILILGAGQVAQSMAPWFAEYELLLWNRTPEKLKPLIQELEAKGATRIRQVLSVEDEERAWARAAHVVICIPPDPENDARRIRLWKGGENSGNRRRSVIHLGGMRNQLSLWNQVEGVFCLDDLFEFQKSQEDARAVQIEQAKRACDEKTKLRALGTSLSMAHGWEDLAVFA